MRRPHKDWLVRIEGDGNNALSIMSQNRTFKTEDGAWRYVERMKKQYPNEHLNYYIAKLESADIRKPRLDLSETVGPDGLDF